ncbi:ferric reductase NAD binding domain-containing protein [Flagelloscypha sp. PMI_526]|nr:ferric reductase NAD binding domain-containing protein [Flagelloscypha sp. PMI_526]
MSGQAGKKPSPDALRAAFFTQEYPRYLWYAIAGYVAAVSFCHWTSWLVNKVSANKQVPTADPETGAPPKRKGLIRLPDALVNVFRVIAFRLTIPMGPNHTINVADIFTASAYVVLVFALTFINTTTLSGHKLSSTYWGSRAAALGVIQLPLVTALATKNNVIGWFTGLSFDRLSFLHRVVARIAFILVWLHAGLKISQHMVVPGKRPFVYYGFTAAILSALVVVISLRPIRAKVYEVFYYLHMILVLTLLVVIYYHTSAVHVSSYVWPCFVIWGLDRFLRVARLVAFNHSYFGFSSGKTMDAKVELQSEHFVRVSMKRPSHFHWAPGQTAYLIIPSVSTLPFEAHPFTISSHDSSHDVADNTIEKGESTADAFWKDIVFLVNVRGGFTQKLAEAARTKGTVKAFIDGPYGPTPELRALDTAVLIAGGSGVSYTLPVLLEIIENVRNKRSSTTKVVFVWALRHPNHILWIADALKNALARAPETLSVEVLVYNTGAQDLETYNWDDSRSIRDADLSDPAEAEKKSSPPPSILDAPNFKLLEGRPDLSALLTAESEATSGTLSVSVCGSSSIASAVRSALSFSVSGPSSILRGSANVKLHIESFGYA